MKFIEQFGKSYEDIIRRVPDVKKIKDYVGWTAKTSIEDGIKKILGKNYE